VRSSSIRESEIRLAESKDRDLTHGDSYGHGQAGFLQSQLEERRRLLEIAVASGPEQPGLASLLQEVDAALDRLAEGTYGLCVECHESIEADRLIADPLVQYCLDHLTAQERTALQRDLDLASKVQRNLLPKNGLRVGGWETSPASAALGFQKIFSSEFVRGSFAWCEEMPCFLCGRL